MSQVPKLSDEPVVNNRVLNNRMMPPMTWNGTLVGLAETATHYLHLTAFPCQKCNGPVIAGPLGTRHDDNQPGNRHTCRGGELYRVRLRPETILAPFVDHCFRPVEWQWAIKPPSQP
jgi:hypothetical protein